MELSVVVTLFMILAIAIFLFSIYLFTYLIIRDFYVTYEIIDDSFKLSFIKKEREEYIQKSVRVFNQLFYRLVDEVAGTSNKELKSILSELSVNDEDIIEFKKIISDLQKDKKVEFVNFKDIEKIYQDTNQFNFFNRLFFNIKFRSDSELSFISDSAKTYSEGKINYDEFAERIKESMTPKNEKKYRVQSVRNRAKMKNSKNLIPTFALEKLTSQSKVDWIKSIFNNRNKLIVSI
ncbi:MAG: hypothetical protein E7C30_03780 [Streptococcus salivarius]|nr:hypothetical protein [Streptococcus salivarius]